MEPDVDRLRDAWRRRSLATGWLAADDWHTEAVDAVVAACSEGQRGRLALACARLGRSRAEAGIGIAETIDDLAALLAVLAERDPRRQPGQHGQHGQPDQHGQRGQPDQHGQRGQPDQHGQRGQPDQRGQRGQHGRQDEGDEEDPEEYEDYEDPRSAGPAGDCGKPPLDLVCSIAEGWAEEGMAQFAQSSCEDPLSGLATLPYLRTRLGEVYREAEEGGASPADTHRLLVVGLPRRGDPWRRMALAILVGQGLRAAFPGGDTLSLARQAGPGPVIALVRARSDLPLRYARLRRDIQAPFGAPVRMARLPGLLTEALRQVDQLAADPADAGRPV